MTSRLRLSTAQVRAAVVAIYLAAIPLLYAAYSHHTWEDYLITFRHSQNLVQGNGLVFYPGERVHGFTSPLGVLLPAIFYWVSGAGSFVPALWLFRIASAAAFACAGLMFLRLVLERNESTSPLEFLIPLCFFGIECKSVVFSANGQETAFMILFLLGALGQLPIETKRNWVALGAYFAALQWTRPDGCIYIGAAACACWCLTSLRRRDVMLHLLRSVALALLLYCPWLIFTWVYYGSPIPNTILAKFAIAQRTAALEAPSERLSDYFQNLAHNAKAIFEPVYATGDWPAWIGVGAMLLAIFCALFWIVPRSNRVTRVWSLMFLLLCLYFGLMPNFFPWYAPPAAMLGYLVIGRLIRQGMLSSQRIVANAAISFGFLIALANLFVFIQEARSLAAQQAIVEDGLRTPLGLWLHDHAKRTDTVYLEPLGYIGYFSQCHMLDYPGLVAPRVRELIAEEHRDLRTCVERLRPDWIVMRAQEIEPMLQDEYIRTHYVPVISFNVRQRVADLRGSIYGLSYLMYDSSYTIFRANEARRN